MGRGLQRGVMPGLGSQVPGTIYKVRGAAHSGLEVVNTQWRLGEISAFPQWSFDPNEDPAPRPVHGEPGETGREPARSSGALRLPGPLPGWRRGQPDPQVPATSQTHPCPEFQIPFARC